jgi:dTDP-4-dehydrorhamnose reductase
MLGSDLLREWPEDELIPATRRDADLCDPAQVRSLISIHRPDWVVLAAAFSDVDGSERAPEAAYAVNEGGTANVAKSAEQSGARVLYISTDYVFDGNSSRPYEPDDAISPLGVYGDSKAKGEAALRIYSSQWCIVRTSWLFGARGISFPEKILNVAKTSLELKVVSDQIGSPTYTRDLAAAIRTLVKGDTRGILNATNAGSCSWFQFAEEILKQAGLSNLIHPISTAESARLAKRPAYSVLSPASLNSRGVFLRSWQAALSDYLQELREFGKLV